jgi:hypothetical protein
MKVIWKFLHPKGEKDIEYWGFKIKNQLNYQKNDFGKRKISWVSSSHMGDGHMLH